MRKHFIYVTSPICAAIIVAGAWLASAGPPVLNPPPGPVGVSGRFGTRTAISSLPFTINQCGSYFLTDCLTGTAGQSGITIAADDVTLDLNGFALVGVPGSLDGVAVPATIKNLTVRSGTIRGWGGQGVGADLATNSQLERLRTSDNGSTGLQVGAGSIVTHCTATGNGSAGIKTDFGCTVVDCTARDNTFDGIDVDAGCTVQNCSAYSNDDDGITIRTGSTALGCAAVDNGDDGFATNNGCMVRNCSARSNGDDGFALGSGCTIAACTASLNAGDGIEVASGSVVRNNSCDGNGPVAADGAGIHVTGSDNRIEGNNVTNNDRGIDFGFPTGGTDNIVIKNTARNNVDGVTLTNYKFPLGVLNTVGEILNFTGGGGIINATNSSPWANFEY